MIKKIGENIVIDDDFVHYNLSTSNQEYLELINFAISKSFVTGVVPEVLEIDWCKNAVLNWDAKEPYEYFKFKYLDLYDQSFVKVPLADFFAREDHVFENLNPNDISVVGDDFNNFKNRFLSKKID